MKEKKANENKRKDVRWFWKQTVLLAALAFLLSMAGAVFLPIRAEAVTQSGPIGTSGLSYVYDEDTKTLTISGTGELGGALREEPFQSMEIKKVVFQACKVTGSMARAFSSSKVEEIDFVGLDTSEVTDMSRMFYGCENLTSLDLSSFNTSNVTNMEGMFADCFELSSLDLSSFNTSNVTDMSGMFRWCFELGSLDLSSFNTSNVTDMSSMFDSCHALNSLDLSSFNTGSVTDMDSMFFFCGSLNSLDLSSFDTSSITNMADMFLGCSSLSSLDLSSFDTSSVTDMWGMFLDCNSLSSLNLGSFDTSSVWDMDEMFRDCSNLMSLDLSSFDTASVTYMESMFSGCSSLAEIKSPHAIAERRHADLPATFYDADLYESTGEYRTMTVMDTSCAGRTLKKYSDDTSGDNGDDDITAEPLPDAVQYVMYEYAIPGSSPAQAMSLLDGALPAGMELQADGKLRGIPMEAGRFVFTIGEAAEAAQTVSGGDDSTPATPKTYRLMVSDNSDANVDVTTDPGYEIIQRVPDFTWDSVSSHTLVSVGGYGEFRDVYIDGVMLEEGKDYTSEEGSTRITIRSETLERFSEPGVHTILVEFRTTESNDLRRAVQNYWVAGPSGDDANEGNVGSGSGDGSGSTDDDDGSDAGSSAVNQNGTAANAPIKYMVARGDVLGRIARRNGISLAQLLAWNPQIKNPNLIFPGQVLVVGYTGGSMEAPALQSLEGAVYDVVQKGDSLYRIAVRNGVSLDKVAALNPELMKQKYIYPGQKVRVK